jgi:predicted membrane GTPase involved in stress response
LTIFLSKSLTAKSNHAGNFIRKLQKEECLMADIVVYGSGRNKYLYRNPSIGSFGFQRRRLKCE